MGDISFEEAKALLGEVMTVCLKLKKCQSLPPEDLKGKYRKAYETTKGQCRDLVNRCMHEVVPWGIAIRESCQGTFRVWMELFLASEEFQRRLAKVSEGYVLGDYEGIMDFLRWFRGRVAQVAATGGAVKQEGAKLFEQ